MDEAEILSSRIAIMAQGSLRCVGTQQRLKSTLGGGYRLTVNFEASCALDLDAYISSALPMAVRTREFRGSSLYLIPTGAGGSNLSSLFKAMECAASRCLIEDWGIGQATLEDVFVRVTEEAEAET